MKKLIGLLLLLLLIFVVVGCTEESSPVSFEDDTSVRNPISTIPGTIPKIGGIQNRGVY